MLERGNYRKYVERLRVRTREVTADVVKLLGQYNWDVFCEPAGGNFLWARPRGIEDSRELVALAENHGVALAPGHFFRPGGETTAWVRINSAYASDPRARAFLEDAGSR
jgi:hypothetical protein